MNARSRLVLLMAVSTLNGCASSIQVSQVETGKSSVGVPWNLAMTQYLVTITRQIGSCGNSLNGTVTITATPQKRVDEDQQYVLNSSGVWATADITSTLAPDGTSLGLNAQSESQAGAIVQNVVGAFAAIAPAVLAAGDPNAPRFKCSKAVESALSTLEPAGAEPLADTIDKQTLRIAELTNKVQQLTTLYLGSKGDKKLLRDLTQAMGALQAEQAKLNTNQGKLAAAQKVLTATQSFMWPTSAKVNQTAQDKPFKLDPLVAQRWIEWSNVKKDDKGKPVVPDPDTKPFDVWLALYSLSPQGAGWAVPSRAPAVGDTKVGVPIRLPRPGRLLACKKAVCPQTLAADWQASKDNIVLASDVPVLQFGQLYVIPVAGGTYKSEGAVIALDANGIPTSVQISEKAAAAAGAAVALQSVASTAAALPGQIAAAKLAKTKATTDQVNADAVLEAARVTSLTAGTTAVANAQTTYLNATASLAAAQANAQTAEGTASANAQSAYLNATSALSVAQANAQAAGVIGQLAARTAIAEQQTAYATQLSQLLAADANAGVSPLTSVLAADTILVNAQAAQLNAQLALAKAQEAMQK
jgi:hypothetical protein